MSDRGHDDFDKSVPVMSRTCKRTQEVKDLQAALAQAHEERAQLQDENAELQGLFDHQHTRMGEATKLWQQATGHPHSLPDLGRLLEWLVDEARKWASRYGSCSEKVERLKRDLDDAYQQRDEMGTAEQAIADVERYQRDRAEKADADLLECRSALAQMSQGRKLTVDERNTDPGARSEL